MAKKLVFLIGAALLATPLAHAQQQGMTPEKRIEKLEKEMRAVQRKVFPGGGGILEPDIKPETPKPESSTSTPALADLMARVDALESQLKSLTGQSEQNAFRLKQLEAQFAAFKAEQQARAAEIAAAASAPAPTAASAPAPAATPAKAASAAAPVVARGAAKPATPAPRPATAPARTAAKAEEATPVSTSAARLAAVKAVAVPNTGNKAEDAYMYGYNLWMAKLYPEAQAQLRKVVETYPTHRRASFAQNLLGRAYLDEGKPNLAITAFYRNFKDRPRGERAPDSLYWMSMALIRLNKMEDACTTLAELDESYGATLSASLKRDSMAAKARAGCQ